MKFPFVELDWKKAKPFPERVVRLVIHTQNARAIFKPPLTSQLKWRNSGRWESQRTEQTLNRPLTLNTSALTLKAMAATHLNSSAKGELGPSLDFCSQIHSLPFFPQLCTGGRYISQALSLSAFRWVQLMEDWVQVWRARREKARIAPILLQVATPVLDVIPVWLQFLEDVPSLHGLSSLQTGPPGTLTPEL